MRLVDVVPSAEDVCLVGPTREMVVCNVVGDLDLERCFVWLFQKTECVQITSHTRTHIIQYSAFLSLVDWIGSLDWLGRQSTD